jgi:hypothetical protein
MGRLQAIQPNPLMVEIMRDNPGFRALTFRHHDPRLIVVMSIDEYTLEEAHVDNLGIRRWLHVSVSVEGQLQMRLADQRRIGRQRRPGERSPVPLPDWYDLNHIAREHRELGFDPRRPIYQVLPPLHALIPEQGDPLDRYANFAEALHLRQPP